jgi:hypothetical protein
MSLAAFKKLAARNKEAYCNAKHIKGTVSAPAGEQLVEPAILRPLYWEELTNWTNHRDILMTEGLDETYNM